MADIVPYGLNRTTGQVQQTNSGDVLTDITGTAVGGGAVSSAVSPFGGTGSDGVIVYSGSQAISGVINATSITINGGVTLTVGDGEGVHFKCTGNFTNNGIIDADGAGITGGAAGTGGPGDSAGFVGGASSYGGDGGDGTTGAGGTGTARAGVFGGGGAVDGPRPAWVTDFEQFTAIVAPGGGGAEGGNGNASSSGGDGGDGGGIIVIEAVGNVTEGTLTADGTAGSNGTNFSGGGGGGGGGMILIMHGGSLTSGTVGATGGAAGLGDGGEEDGDAGEGGLIRKIQMSVEAPAASASPPGAVTQYAGSAEPAGWLFCDGQEVSRTTYSALFASISTTYGVGDGSTTFNVPDARGKSSVGANNSGLPNGLDGGFTTRDLADTGGAETHQLSVSEMPSHGHSTNNNLSNGSGSDTTRVAAGTTPDLGGPQLGGIQNTGGDGSHNTMHPFLVFNYIIKT